MRLPPIRFKLALLSVLNASLVVILTLLWNQGEIRVHATEHLAVHQLTPPDVSILLEKPLPPTDMALLLENSVFHTQRSYFRAPPPSEAIAAPEYDMAGSMSLPQGKRVAFLKNKADHTNRTLHVGDDLEGWRVDLIEASRVVVVREGQHVEIRSGILSSDASGLIRRDAPPRSVSSGIRVLGQPSVQTFPLTERASTARTYVPPPPPH